MNKKIKKEKNKITLPFQEIPVHKIKIRVIGIGSGGNSIVSEIASKIASLGRDKISFYAIDTNPQALKKTSSKVSRFCFGQNITHGLGTGMDTELGKIIAKNEKERIKKILKGADLYILVTALGGGTGSGAAPVLAKISRDFGNLTYGIFTLPFKFEGEKKMEIAKDSLEKLKPSLSALSILPNDRIFQVIDKKTPLKVALSIINKNLAESLESLLQLAYLPGLINIDFADLKAILEFDPSLKKGKLTYLNTIEIEGKDKVNQAIKKVISSPLYPYGIEGARGILFNITGEKNISLNDVSQISRSICDIVKGQAKIIFGVSQDSSYKDKIKITLLATDCRSKIFSSVTEIEKIKKQISNLRKKSAKRVNFDKPETKISNRRKVRKKTKPKTSFKSINTFKNQSNSALQPHHLKIRRNALEIKETVKKEEENKLVKEKFWEIPAFLRKKDKNQNSTFF